MEGLIGLAATLFGQQNALTVDVATVAIGRRSWWSSSHGDALARRDRPFRLGSVIAAVCLGLLLDPHLYAQDCVLVLILVALVLTRPTSAAGAARRRGFACAPQGPPSWLPAPLLLDLSAIDTYWVQGISLKPLHLSPSR